MIVQFAQRLADENMHEPGEVYNRVNFTTGQSLQPGELTVAILDDFQ